jgi:hypothetical protein
MKNTIQVLLFMMLITGMLLTACGAKEEVVEDIEEVVEDVEDAEEEEAEVEEAEEVVVERGIADPVEEEAEVEEAEEVSETPPTVNIVIPKKEEPEPETSVYADGSYTQTGSYQNPVGSEDISVSITLADDKVTGVIVTLNAVNVTTKQYQDLFSGGISSVVVGKSLEELGATGNVNGSSLTPKGFNDAVAAIKSAAKN